jgi:hypothetical protein
MLAAEVGMSAFAHAARAWVEGPGLGLEPHL